MRHLASALLILMSTISGAQTPRLKPQFEVATVRLARVDDSPMAGLFREVRRNTLTTGKIPISSPDRISLQDWSLLDLIAVAYNVKSTLVFGPPWLSQLDFDIEAEVPVGTRQEELNAMLQALLEERFALKVHSTHQVSKGYALTVDRAGPRLTPAVAPLDVSQSIAQDEQQAKALQGLAASKPQDYGANTFSYVTWPAVTLDELADHLQRFTETPVTNATGIQGKYAVTIQVSQGRDGSESTIFDAVKKLGLRLEPRKMPFDSIVVDDVSKTPTQN